jgi:hypothetical protein
MRLLSYARRQYSTGVEGRSKTSDFRIKIPKGINFQKIALLPLAILFV